MDNRETQFAGFAKALFKELLGSAGYIDMNEYDTDEVDCYEQIIAQRAYDLVGHAVGYGLEYVDECGHTLSGNINERVQHSIPDMKELPEVSE